MPPALEDTLSIEQSGREGKQVLISRGAAALAMPTVLEQYCSMVAVLGDSIAHDARHVKS